MMKRILFLFLVSVSVQGYSQKASFINPILPGGYPDPSICRVEDNFYIVNSSFEYFPGLPIHKSKDLVNWELIGYGLHKKEQCTDEVNLVDVQSDGGIHAPTIRYNQGTFYIITTNVYYHKDTKTTDFINFIITAKDPAGPWSEPHVLEGAPGIDPDIFFDEDGRAWYVGTHSPDKPNFPGEGEIWLQEIDLDNWKLTGERSFLWRGACGGVWAEGPHMYRKDGRYYLMIAEGGTSYNHAMMIAVSDDIRGPYVPNDRNPIMTSRHLSYDNWVHSTGHADLVELEDGRWYMVALGIRGDERRGSNMGRETFLLPMQWEREPFDWKEIKYEWPVIAPLTGRVERFNPLVFQGTSQKRNSTFIDFFDKPGLNLAWNFRRVPIEGMYSLDPEKGKLTLYAMKETIRDRGRAAAMGFRQSESDFEYQVKMQFDPAKDGSEAGALLIQKDNNYISFTLIKRDKVQWIQLKLITPEEGTSILKEMRVDRKFENIIFKIESTNHQYEYTYSLDGRNFEFFHNSGADLVLSKKYTGANLGIYATGNGNQNMDKAVFDWVMYKGFQKF
ncbi:glycoside hydrolase family 43 protein [Lutimonas saemankumensis]|uniref:glycoside hydrolase family 43 protein n=1 Tax=Lutimonas saemankumensis TaxID=483016 RepID=UPI001CD64C6C|nr:glycoside hydrolase family 43 protein [Lutimonas saemankumensis]MCA0932991.1 glycoside hydrolase family 43 protein [Lutimonas saemankumensis]